MNISSEKRFEVKGPAPVREKWSFKRYSGAAFLIFVVLLAMVGLLGMILLQWGSLNQRDRILPASLLAVSTADYSGARPTGQVPVIGMGIVGDMMKDDNGLQPGDLTTRLAAVTALFLSPVPTATALLPQNLVPGSTRLPTLENSPAPRATVTGAYHPIATASLAPPAVSQTVPATTGTVPAATSTVPPISYPTDTLPPVPKPSSTPQPPTIQPPTSQPATVQPPPPPPDPPKATKEPKPPKDPKPTKEPKPPKDPKPTKKPKK